MITRFAPTPSGYLHAGNAINALLVHWLAQAHDGTVVLRIDDADAARARDAYVDDIFDVLAWLEIDWQLGPRDARDFVDRYSQQDRTAEYRAALDAAVARGLPVYACRCSRRDQVGVPTGGCTGGCRDAGLPLEVDRTALRVVVPRGSVIDVEGVPVALDTEFGDFVVWRRDDLPAYQVVSLVEDERIGVTHIVRGADLRASTAAQRYLAPYFDAQAFAAADVIHHGLVTDESGGKLSKSQSSHGPMPRTDASRAHIEREALRIGAPVGITP